MRALLKAGVERALAANAVTRFTRRAVRGKRLVLAYHAVTPTGAEAAGERALAIAQRIFAAHLELLGNVAAVLPLDAPVDPDDARTPVSITFDDAYAGAVGAGLDEVVARRLPATIFVAPGCVDGHTFWWDALAHTRGTLDDAVRAHALGALGGASGSIRDWARAAGLSWSEDLPAHARAADELSILAAAARPGISLGSHSWSHANLARLAHAALDDELARPLRWLRDSLPSSRVAPWIAYPYGLANARVRAAARAAGYASACAVTGGFHRPAVDDAMNVPRLNVPAGLSVDGLRARLLGAVRA